MMTNIKRLKAPTLFLVAFAALAAPLVPSLIAAQPCAAAALPPATTAQGAVASPAGGSAAVQARDLDATVGWYRDVMGFRVISERAAVRGRSVLLERRGMLLEIAEGETSAQTQAAGMRDVDTTASAARPVLSLLVGDVDAEVERLASRDVTVVADPDDDLDGHFRTSWIRDPEGRVVELREPIRDETGETP